MKPRDIIRLSKGFLIVAALIILTLGSSIAVIPVRAPSAAKIVYVAIGVDTESLNGSSYVGSVVPHPTLDVSEYSRTVPMTVAAVFNSDFRDSHRDSFGNIFKMSWFPEMDYLMAQSNFVWANGSSAGVSGYTAIRDLLVNNWGTEIQTYGDSIEYHHHFMIYDGTWKRYDSGPDAGYPEYEMYALDHMIIDRNFYPSSWRSGDWIMPPALSSWLEQWMPFDYTPTTGIWFPVHPSGMDRWQTNCPYAPDVISSVNAAFAYASEHGSAVYSLCTHDKENMQSQVAWLQSNLATADANEATYPSVSFQYVSAREAMRLALGFTDFTPPTFTVTSSGSTYTIVSSEPLWKNHPYIALKYTDGTYGHMNATPTGTNTWTVTPPTSVSAIGVAGSDLYGNPGAALLNKDQNAYTLTVSTVGSGSVAKNPDQATYASGTVVTLTAVPAAGWSFSSWSGALTGSTNPASLTITGNMAVTATFTQNTYTLTVSTVGSGSVTKVPNPVSTFGYATQGTYSVEPLNKLIAGYQTAPARSGTLTKITARLNGVWVTGATMKAKCALYYGSNKTLVPNSETNEITWTNTVNAAWYDFDYAGRTPPSVTAGVTYNIVVWASTSAGGSIYSINVAFDRNISDPTFYGITQSLSYGSAFPSSLLSPVNTPRKYSIYATYVPDQASYHLGDVVQLTAVPAAGWSFSSWSGALTGSTNPASLTITGDMAVTATFTPQNAYSLTVSTVGSGSVAKNPDQATYASGTVVTLTATPAAGWSFSAWSGDLSGSVNPTTITINGNRTVTATFVQNTYTLTVTTMGSGSVSLNNTGPYHYGDAVQLTAAPTVGWSFQSWSGDLLGSVNPVTTVINGNKAVTATFTQNTYTLTVNSVGSGNVNLNNTGPYYYGDVVQLTAVPSAGWSFQSWSGELVGSANPATILINGNKAVTATFTRNVYTLTATVAGSGSVNRNNTGPYYYGDIVELTSVPTVGWSFDHWSGDLSGSVNPTTILIDGNKGVTATFTQNMYSLTITTVGSGSVNLNNSGSYHYGDSVQLTANPTIGWSFDHWDGDLSGSANPTTILINGNKAVTAYFTQDVYTLAVDIVGQGSVNLNNTGPYHYGDVVEFTAVPAAGWSFSDWNGDLTGSLNPVSLIIKGTTSVTATFTQNTYTLTVSTVGSGSVAKVPDQASYTWGTNVALTANASVGWSFAGWSGDVSGMANPVMINMTGNMAVTATFINTTYRITVTQGANGVISPATIDVEYGSDKTFTITPDNGYHIFDVVVDDISQGAVPSYLFSNVVANHTISAIFSIDEYTPYSIVSNSTISELAFNSTSQILRFTASGPSGTSGFSNVTISKTLIADASGLEVYLDGTKTSYVVSDLPTSWLIYITYQHSTHKIEIVNTKAIPEFPSFLTLALFMIATLLAIMIYRKRRSEYTINQQIHS